MHDSFFTPVVEHWLERELVMLVHHEGSIRRPIAPWANALTTELHIAPTDFIVRYSQIPKNIIFKVIHPPAGDKFNYVSVK